MAHWVLQLLAVFCNGRHWVPAPVPGLENARAHLDNKLTNAFYARIFAASRPVGCQQGDMPEDTE